MRHSEETSDKVMPHIGQISLPTYALQGENRNPVFRSQYGVAHIYPYTLQDEIASEAEEKSYLILVLENRYLRVTVLPELGGRVYSVFDKLAKREVFYKNEIIKFSPLAIRGAFFSGGIEFSFPVAHAPTTASPVNWDILEKQDGSASIVLGGIEHISGMRWSVMLTLFPDRCAMAQDVRLYNPTPIPGRYHYWTNASLESTDGTEFVYPLQRVRSYEFPGTASWPIARLDLITEQPGLPGMEGVPMWPASRMHDPVNFMFEKDMLAQVSIFGRNVNQDFFGVWQHESDTGYAHFARHQDVSGMKLWSWGRSDVGIVNQTALTDDGSIYAETQCGAMETQLDFDFLPPGRVRTWREWWLPLRDLGGLTCASEELGARLHMSPGNGAHHVNLTFGICPVRILKDAHLKLSIPDRTLFQEKVSASPENTWLKDLEIESGLLSGNPLMLEVRDNEGRMMLSYTHSRDTSYDERPVSLQDGTHPESAEDFYQLGLKHENFDNRIQALESYQEALLRSDEYGPAHYRLGLMLLRSADFAASGYHLKRAEEVGIAGARYYLGLISFYNGDIAFAGVHFGSVPVEDPLHQAALHGLASIAMFNMNWEGAISLLANVDVVDSPSLGLLLGMALARAGRDNEALDLFEKILLEDPLNLPAKREILKASRNREESYGGKLQAQLADDQTYGLDLASFYLDVGLLEEAAEVLSLAGQDWHYPMVFYMLSYIYEKLGEGFQAAQSLERAQGLSPEFVFPNRIWEVIALNHALVQNPQDAKAKYYLGNFLYAHQRFEEAASLWEAALPVLSDFDVIHRNLALYYWYQEEDPLRAIELLERALQLNPNNADLYLHLDDLYHQQGYVEKRAELLEKMLALGPIREDLRKRTLVVMVELGRFEEALKILTEEQFVPLEMDQSFHKVYISALMQRAENHMKRGEVDQAIEDYRRALDFPENHGVGKPVITEQAEILYRLGCAYESAGNFNEAILAWKQAADEHHSYADNLFRYIQMSLDKLSRYAGLGYPV